MSDILMEDDQIHVAHDARRVPLPPPLRALLAQGKAVASPESFVFTGRSPNRPLSQRTLQRIVKGAATQAGIGKPITPMSLRHSCAVHALERGANERVLQTVLILENHGPRTPNPALKEPR